MKVIHLDQRDGVVATLEGVLEKARLGNVDGVAIALQMHGDHIGTAYHFAKAGNVWILLGAVDELHFRLVAEHQGD